MDWVVQIETNGTQPKVLVDCLKNELCVAVISPKASNTKGYRYFESFFNTYANDAHRDRIYFKYVIDSDPSATQHTVPEDALEYAKDNPSRVYVSPAAVYKKAYEGEVSSAWDHELIDPVRTAANYAYAAEYCMTHGLRLSIQQHLFCAIA